jgi:Tfp pilus assembly ATPase PilU
MRKFASLFVLFGLCAMPAFAAVETYKDVPVVDVNCSKKVAADPDSHTRACALKCEKSGYGIVTKDQQFLKLDAEGNTKIVEALKASDKKDHLRVDVSGEVQGDTLKVASIKLL